MNIFIFKVGSLISIINRKTMKETLLPSIDSRQLKQYEIDVIIKASEG